MNLFNTDKPTEAEDGSATMIEIVFVLLLTLIIFVRVRDESAVPTGSAKGNNAVRKVPADAVIVVLDEQGALTVQGQPSGENDLLQSVASQITPEKELAFYAHPAVKHGNARRIQLLLETQFTVLNAFTKDDTK